METLKELRDKYNTTFKGKHYLCNYDDNEDCNKEEYNDYEKEISLRTFEFEKDDKDDAQTYINTIEKRFCGKLNRKTLEIKKAEFKDGDIITIKPHIGNKLIYLFKAEDNEKYYGHAFLAGNIIIVNEDSYCYKNFCAARLSMDEEKQLLSVDFATGQEEAVERVTDGSCNDEPTSAWDSPIKDCRISEVYHMTGEQIREYFNL